MLIFKGNLNSFRKEVYFDPVSLAGSLIIPLCILGEYLFFPLWIGYFLLLVMAACIGTFFGSLCNNFYFDDQKKEIVKKFPFGILKSVPYHKIKAIHILKGKEIVMIHAYLTKFNRVPIITTDKDDKQALIQEFKNRSFLIKEKKSLLQLLGILSFLIPFIGAVAFHTYVYQRFPQAAVRAVEYKRDIKKAGRGGLLAYAIDDTKFFLPYRMMFQKATEGALVFESMDKKEGVVVGRPLSFDSLRDYSFLLRLAGIKTEHDFFRAIYRSRIGIVPLILRSCSFSGEIRERKIYEINNDKVKGFLFRGLRKSEDGQVQVEQLYLAGEEGRRRIDFTIISSYPDKIYSGLCDILINTTIFDVADNST